MSFFLVRGCHRGRGRWVRWRRRRIWWISHDKPTSAFLHQKMLNKLALPDWAQEFLNSSITDWWVKVFGFMPKQIWHMHRTLAKVMVSQELFKDNTNHQSPTINHVWCIRSALGWYLFLDLGNLTQNVNLLESLWCALPLPRRFGRRLTRRSGLMLGWTVKLVDWEEKLSYFDAICLLQVGY